MCILSMCQRAKMTLYSTYLNILKYKSLAQKIYT